MSKSKEVKVFVSSIEGKISILTKSKSDIEEIVNEKTGYAVKVSKNKIVITLVNSEQTQTFEIPKNYLINVFDGQVLKPSSINPSCLEVISMKLNEVANV